MGRRRNFARIEELFARAAQNQWRYLLSIWLIDSIKK